MCVCEGGGGLLGSMSTKLPCSPFRPHHSVAALIYCNCCTGLAEHHSMYTPTPPTPPLQRLVEDHAYRAKLLDDLLELKAFLAQVHCCMPAPSAGGVGACCLQALCWGGVVLAGALR